MKKYLLGLVLCLFMYALYAAPVWDTPTCIRQGGELIWNGSSALTSEGDIVYVWSDISSGSRDIYAQMFNPQGNPVWLQPVRIDNSQGSQENPQIIATSAGTYVICWIDYQLRWLPRICAQAIDESGAILWGIESKVICSTQNHNSNLKLLAGENGHSYVIWEDNQNQNVYGQYLDISGNFRWVDEGKQLTFLPGNEHDTIALSTADHGFILGYQINSDTLFSYLMRYNQDGEMVWGKPLNIHPEMSHVSLKTVNTYNENSLLITWSCNSTDSVFVEMLNLDGNQLWQTPTILPLDIHCTWFWTLRCTILNNDKIIISWTAYAYQSIGTNIFMHMLNSSGGIEWSGIQSPTTKIDSADPSYLIIKDLAGGFFVIWQGTFHSPNKIKVFIQRIASNGTLLWDVNGTIVVDHEIYFETMRGRFQNNALSLEWEDHRNTSQGIFKQVYNEAGIAQLETNGKALATRIAGSLPWNSPSKTLRRSNDTIIFWYDTRLKDKYCLYYQIIDDNGVPLLEANGRELAVLNDIYDSYSIALGDDDQVAIAWEHSISFTSDIYAQLINRNGRKLWGENGMQISGTDTNYNINPAISFEDGAFYIGWYKFFFTNGVNSRVAGQKIVSGVLQWGENGIFISIPYLSVSSSSPLVTGRYYVWAYLINGQYLLFAKRVTPEGLPAEGWFESGRRIDNSSDPYLFQSEPIISSNEQGLFILWTDRRGNHESLYAQHISPQGQLMWEPEGRLIYNQGVRSKTQVVNDHNVQYLWLEPNQDHSSIQSSNYDLNGIPVWEDLQVFEAPEMGPTYWSICQFENGGNLVGAVFYDYLSIDISYLYLDQQGLPSGPMNGINLSRAQAGISALSMSQDAQNAYITWAEYSWNNYFHEYTDGYPYDINGLFLQKMNNEIVSNQDASLPPISLSLEQNYPNPFNPNTTIRYSLPSLSNVKLDIYNIKGQHVRSLVHEQQNTGVFNIQWNGRDDADQQVASGIYFYRLNTEQKSVTRKMVLLK